MGTETQFAPILSDRPRIPLVGHTITDEDIGALQGLRIEQVNLKKAVKLLTDPHSAMLYDRHVHALNKVYKHYQAGFLMKDLVQVFQVINVCADRIDDQPIYEEPMCKMLKLCSRPFIKEKASDEMVYERIAIESVSQLGYLMRVPSRDIRIQICKTLISFYCEIPPPQLIQKHQASNLSYNQKIVESSDVPETLVKSLALSDSDLKVRLVVLTCLQHFSQKSAKNCDMMLKAAAASCISSHLNDLDPSGELLFRSVDILWNLFEKGNKEMVATQMSHLKCIGQIRDAFIQQLTQGYSHYDRQLRNDLLIIASLVAQITTNVPFVETGFAKQLTLFSTFQEVKSHNPLVKSLRLSTNHEDFELKKLLINILVSLSKDSAVLPLLAEGRLLLALFAYVKGNEFKMGPQEWSIAQFEEIQLHAISALCTLGPLMIEDYMTCQGNTRLLIMLEWCSSTYDFAGHGNSFHGQGGRGNKRAQMRHCLRLLRSMVSTDHEIVLQDLVDQGAVNQLIGILGKMCEHDGNDDAIDVEMQCDMLFILSALCEGDTHRKELYGSQGVEIVCKYLKTDPKMISSGLGHHRLMLATVDCIWCCVVGCYITEDDFLEKEGVFLLIDLLKVCPKNMHNLILGCLLDLTENIKTMTHINAWRGKDDVTVAHLFCSIWRQEEQEIGVARKGQGVIAEATKPLMGTLQENEGVISLPADCPSQAIVDVSENMRAKLYALFGKVGFIDLPGLTTDDHVTLTIIEKYLDFKLGEVWTEISEELQQDSIRPVTPDCEAIEGIHRAIEQRAVNVIDTQTELLEAQHSQDLLDEQQFYAEIRENHRQKEKAIMDFNDYVLQTSNYGILKVAKERQDLSIDASRVQNRIQESETFHSFEMPALQTTTFSSRHINIDSTPVEITGGPLADYDPLEGTLKKRSIIKA